MSSIDNRISSGVGAFSGINRDDIITKLLSIDARPKATSQKKIVANQKLQAVYLDIIGKTRA